MQVDAQHINLLFAQQNSTPEGRAKFAARSQPFIKDRLREESFARGLITPENVTRNHPDCQVSQHHDTLEMVIEIQPQSRAMTIDFRGEPDARLISAPRALTGFFTISSERVEKPQQELLAYKMPITKLLEEQFVLDIQEIEDREFLIHAEAAVQVLQAEANSVAAAPILAATELQGASPPVEFSVRKGELARIDTIDSAIVHPLQKSDIIEGYKLLDGNYLRAECVLMTEVQFDDIHQWTTEDTGNAVQSETTINGYKYTVLVGRKFVRTIKTDILRPGNVYFFTNEEFLGRFFILNDVEMYIDKRYNTFEMQCWEDIAMALVNVAAVKKVELYSGDATLHDNDSIRAAVVPKDEKNLGAVNHRVDKGWVFPQVQSY